jgi:hypothetical protein
MTITTTDVANLALLKLGDKTVDLLTDISDVTKKSARAINTLFVPLRDDMLRQHPWNFAMRRAQLVASVLDAPDFGFTYLFDLPDDYLRLKSLETRCKFTLEGRTILSDEETLDIVYIGTVDDPTEWDPLFLEAFVTRLAAEAAFSISGSPNVGPRLMEDYKDKMQKAKTVDAQENYSEDFIKDHYRQERNVPGSTSGPFDRFPY